MESLLPHASTDLTGVGPEVKSTLNSVPLDISAIHTSTFKPDDNNRQSFLKKSKSSRIPFQDSSELGQIASFFYNLDTKFYHCGFVYKMNALGADGTPLFKNASASVIADNGGNWSKWWMEIVGLVLHLWRVPDEISSFGYTAGLSIEQLIKNELDPSSEVLEIIKTAHGGRPLLINISDSVTEIFPENFTGCSFPDNPAPPVPYTCFFSLSSTASNLYLFAAASSIQVNHWVTSIRLAIFELQRLNQLYTQRILNDAARVAVWQQFNLDPFSSLNFRGEIRHEGPLQIRLPYSNLWKQFHVVVTSVNGPPALIHSKTASILFPKKETPTSPDPSKRGSILFYETKKALKKGRMPIFVMENVENIFAIWPSGSKEKAVKKVCLARIEGTLQLAEPPVEPFASLRSYTQFEKGIPEIQHIADIEALISGADIRPAPTDILILAVTTESLTEWVIAVNAAFSLESASPLLEQEVAEITKLKAPEEGKPVDFAWPCALYFNPGELSGISMPINSFRETWIIFNHYLLQKTTQAKAGTISSWSQHVAKGEWERGLCDRKEMEFKFKALFDWVNVIIEKLRDHSIIVTKPHPSVLVAAMATVMSWLGPVLSSMVGSNEDLTPTSPTDTKPPTVSDSDGSKIGIPQQNDSIPTSDSTDGEGSISEDDPSDEGSKSEEEDENGLFPETRGFELISGEIPAKSGEEFPGDSDDESSEEYQVYAPNSLLSQLPNRSSRTQGGPFFNTAEEEYRKSLLAPKRDEDSGPLLGVIKDPSSSKLKLQSGLLGVIERREEATKKGTKSYGLLNNGASSTADRLIIQLSGAIQKMLFIMRNPVQKISQETPDILLAELSHMESLINIYHTMEKHSNNSGDLNNRNSTNPFTVPQSISWNKSMGSSSKSAKSGESTSSASLPTSSSNGESSGKVSSSAGTETSGKSELSSLDGESSEDEPLIKHVSKSDQSDSSESSEDEPLATAINPTSGSNKMSRISFQPPKTTFAPKMYKIPKAGKSSPLIKPNSSNVSALKSRETVATEHRLSILSAPVKAPLVGPERKSSAVSSEGSLSDDSV